MEELKFRQAAIEHVTSLTRLDHMIRITSPFLWVMMLAIYSLLVAVVVWGFWGSIPTTVQGQGILVSHSGSVFNAAAPQGESRVLRFSVLPGDKIKKGQVLAVLDNPNLREQIKVNTAYLAQLTNTYNRKLVQARQQILTYQANLTSQNQVLQDIITSETKALASIQDFLKLQQSSFQKGLDTKERVVGTLQQFYQSEQAIDNSRQRLSQNKIDEANYIEQWRQKLEELETRVRDQQYKLNDLQSQLRLAKMVTSPIDGLVIDLLTAVGTTVHSGDPVVNIASVGQGEDAIIYVPAANGKRIEPNMRALVSPGTVKKEEFGSIRGKVISVSRFPVSRQAMLAMLENDNLVEMFTKAGPPIAVRINLEKSNTTFSGFAWTSSKGPKQYITPGTLASVEVTVREQPPITLIIPIFKKWLGFD